MSDEEPVERAIGPAGLLAARLAHTEDGRRGLVAALVRFATSGILSLGADLGLLFLLHTVAGVELAVATAISFTVSLVVNYSLNRNWTFQSDESHRRTVVRFLTIVAINIGTTLLVVLGLTSIGLYYLLSKMVAVALNASLNFLSARHWVYAKAPEVET